MQQNRRDPYPWTWEPAAAGAFGFGVIVLLGIHLGRSLACLVSGQGLRITERDALFSSAWPILTGDASAGLAGSVNVPVSALAISIVFIELALIAGCTVGLIWVSRRWGPLTLKGLAAPREVGRLLGVRRLRKDRRIIRRDLCAARPNQTHRAIKERRPTTQLRSAIELLARSNRAEGVKLGWPKRLTRQSRRSYPTDVGWRIGKAKHPSAGELWCPWDRTAGVIGPQGSGKTLDLLTPALLGAPGAALVTLTKADDLLLSITARSRKGPIAVLDPFGLAPGLPAMVWDPIVGCVDPMIAERRAKAFTAGTVKAGSAAHGDDAARFYAAEAAKVVQAYFHAAALTGRTLDDVLQWVANPLKTSDPSEILREHPHAERFWYGLLHGALHGDDRTAGNTITTVQQTLALFFQADIRQRCVPSADNPATDIADLIQANGTMYLLGREDPYASASPLMTALTEHVLDTALELANQSPYGRLCPPMVSVLDELPSTAPLPTLRTRMANERALGLSFIYAAQTWRQLASILGEQDARALFGLTNVLVVFGGSKDVSFNKEISELAGTVRVSRTTWQTGQMAGRNVSGEDIPVLRPEMIRELEERHALVVAENGKPIIAELARCIDGKRGKALRAEQAAARERLSGVQSTKLSAEQRRAAALAEARRLGLIKTTEPEGTPA